MNEWYVLICGSRTLVAKKTPDEGAWEPVYELTWQALPTPQGIMDLEGVRPLAGVPSWRRVRLEGVNAITPLSELARADRDRIMQRIGAAELQRSGLVVATGLAAGRQ